MAGVEMLIGWINSMKINAGNNAFLKQVVSMYVCIQPLTVATISSHAWPPGGVACHGNTCHHRNSLGRAPCAGLSCRCTAGARQTRHHCSDACGTWTNCYPWCNTTEATTICAGQSSVVTSGVSEKWRVTRIRDETAKIKAISSDTHQLHATLLRHFRIQS